jgi:hypothetical protein
VQALVMQTLQQVLTAPDINGGAQHQIPAQPGMPVPPQEMPPGPAPEQQQPQFQSPPAQPGQPLE